VALCEGYLGVYPCGELFCLYFNIRHNKETNGDLCNCGSISFIPCSGKTYPYIKPHDSTRGWRGSFFYQADQAPPKKKFGLRSFVDGPAEEQDTWGILDDSTINEECQILSRWITKLHYDGLTGIDTIHCWLSRMADLSMSPSQEFFISSHRARKSLGGLIVCPLAPLEVSDVVRLLVDSLEVFIERNLHIEPGLDGVFSQVIDPLPRRAE
jgi:hypothetical protein